MFSSNHLQKSGVWVLIQLAYLTVLSAQNSAFILVDVSASGPDIEVVREEAKGIVHDICVGNYSPENYQTYWEWSGEVDTRLKPYIGQKGRPLINPTQRGYALIMPFGNKNTYKGYRMNPVSGDIQRFSTFYEQYFPRFFKDNHTYIDIALAKAADIAKERMIDSYWLIEITDRLQDTDSQAPDYSTQEQLLIDQYGTVQINETKLGTLRYTGQKKNYQIIFKIVKIGNAKSANAQETHPGELPLEQSTSNPPVLNFVRPAKKGRQNPSILESEELTVVWNCKNCPREVAFSLRLDCLECAGPKYESKSTKNSQVNFKIEESGLYKLSLTTRNIPTTLTTTTYVQVNAGTDAGGAFFKSLILIIVLSSVFYLVYKLVRQSQQSAPETVRPNHIGTGGDVDAAPTRPPPNEGNLEDLFNDF